MVVAKVADVVYAYIAGIIDGEGSITVNHRQHQQPVVRVSVANTDERIMILLKSVFGGSVYIQNPSRSSKHKICYGWEVSAKKAEYCLQAVLSYLLIKRDRAEIALSIRKLSYSRNGYMESKDQSERWRLVEQLQVLNKLGPKEETRAVV
jgi:hypothetical protein